MNTTPVSSSSGNLIVIIDRLARLMPAPAELSRGFEVWPSRLAPPPETKEPDGEPEEPERQYPFWTWFIENPRPKS
jgi:hypothetical protein